MLCMDLRVGNLIVFKGIVVEVFSVSESVVCGYTLDGDYVEGVCEEFSKMPLDWDWIEEFGGSIYDGCNQSEFVRFGAYDFELLLADDRRTFIGPNRKVVSTVDQLQNLFYYYLASGVELTLIKK